MDDELLSDEDPDEAESESENQANEPERMVATPEDGEPAHNALKLVQCPHCPNPVREDRLQRHIDKVHGKRPAPAKAPSIPSVPAVPPQSQPATTNSFVPDIPIERLSFELLRPGTWDIDDVIRHYRAQARTRPELYLDRVIDYGRLEALKKLRPVKCYIGRELWDGYVVFEFNGTRNVVLECPVEGNATYVLSGDWKRMVGHSKAYLREHYPHSYTKVVHKGDWLDRVRYAL
ncbi:MAG: hypothetical protein KJZ78_00250 [Bryobacteraceae bacterium]|nr:hypothetical protein [Bryobacteraceae bacterium]